MREAEKGEGYGAFEVLLEEVKGIARSKEDPALEASMVSAGSRLEAVEVQALPSLFAGQWPATRAQSFMFENCAVCFRSNF